MCRMRKFFILASGLRSVILFSKMSSFFISRNPSSGVMSVI